MTPQSELESPLPELTSPMIGGNEPLQGFGNYDY